MSHVGGTTAVVVGAVVVGEAVGVVVGTVVDAAAQGSTIAGASSEGAASGTPDGVGTGIVDGCARAPAVPEINISATALTVTSDRDVERNRLLHSDAGGFGEIVMNFLQSEVIDSKPGTADSIFTETSQVHNRNQKHISAKTVKTQEQRLG